LNDENRRVKTVSRFKVSKKRIPKSVLERRKWARFGQDADMSLEDLMSKTTYYDDEITMQFLRSRTGELLEFANSEFSGLDTQRSTMQFRMCRFCKSMDHWSTQCPYRDVFEEEKAKEAAADAGAQSGGDLQSSRSGVTMKDRPSAERACKEPNPIIDGRKANVNLAYLGAKPRNNLHLGFPLPLPQAAAAMPTLFPANRLGLQQIYYPTSQLIASPAGLILPQLASSATPSAAAQHAGLYSDYNSVAAVAAAAAAAASYAPNANAGSLGNQYPPVPGDPYAYAALAAAYGLVPGVGQSATAFSPATNGNSNGSNGIGGSGGGGGPFGVGSAASVLQQVSASHIASAGGGGSATMTASAVVNAYSSSSASSSASALQSAAIAAFERQ
ncbi:Eukaryotic translation initiation factor 3 subunit G, partial [Trichinella sp. T6]